MPAFTPGQVVATPAAIEAIARNGEQELTFLRRHLAGDWGTVDDDSKAQNDQALIDTDFIQSVYTLQDGTTIWIITDAGWAVTTILLPSDY